MRIAAVSRGTTVEETLLLGTSMAGLAETDAQGRFTLEDIPQGRYSIAAGRLDLQTYYPGTQSLNDATVFTVKPGETISGINFTLSNSSAGRAAQGGFWIIQITASIPVRVNVENGGKLPVTANGRVISIKLENSSNAAELPLGGTQIGFAVPGPISGDVRVVFENLPDLYEVKSITYGSRPIPNGVFSLSPANFPTMTPNSTQALQSVVNGATIIRGYVGATTLPPLTPPSPLTITIGEKARLPTNGVRVSGSVGTTARRAVYISGNPGVLFSDGTFEFRNVPPGRHLIAAPSLSTPLASIVVVGDKDVTGVDLKETFVLPGDVREPKAPLPADGLAPGTIVPFARIVGTVLEEKTRVPITEGDIVVKSGDYSRTVPIDNKGHFETFLLLPGTYELKPQIFGHATSGPTIVVGDKDVTLDVTSLRLY